MVCKDMPCNRQTQVNPKSLRTSRGADLGIEEVEVCNADLPCPQRFWSQDSGFTKPQNLKPKKHPRAQPASQGVNLSNTTFMRSLVRRFFVAEDTPSREDTRLAFGCKIWLLLQGRVGASRRARSAPSPLVYHPPLSPTMNIPPPFTQLHYNGSIQYPGRDQESSRLGPRKAPSRSDPQFPTKCPD